MRLSITAGLVAITVAALLAGCGGGPSKGEFVAACMKGQGFQQLTEEMCACAADVAKSRFSKAAYAAMVYDMQGKDQEAEAITVKMSDDERMQVLQGTGEIFGKCFVGKEPGFR